MRTREGCVEGFRECFESFGFRVLVGSYNAELDRKPMAYFIDLFSPETYDAFAKSARNVSGFRSRHKNGTTANRCIMWNLGK
jgi:hypothetical protein